MKSENHSCATASGAASPKGYRLPISNPWMVLPALEAFTSTGQSCQVCHKDCVVPVQQKSVSYCAILEYCCQPRKLPAQLNMTAHCARKILSW